MGSSTVYHTVLVTGANAFYSAAIMDCLVKDNIMIHAAVRKEYARGPLEERYGRLIKVFIVPDITIKTAFNEAIKGCDAVFHVASPLKYNFSNARTEVLDPAINGVLSALIAAVSEPLVKRVILTSSVAACLNPVHESGFQRPGYTYTEADWNPLTYQEASGMTAFGPVYTASKALAEKAAWDFMKQANPPPSFDLVSINPCHTWGTFTQHVSSPSAMNSTNSDLSKLMDGEEPELPPTIMPWMTDIHEVAQAHVNALHDPGASGRYIIANSAFDFQQVVDLMHTRYAHSDWITNVPKGHPGQKVLADHFMLDSSRSRKELGVEYGPWEQTVVDFCDQYQDFRRPFFPAREK